MNTGSIRAGRAYVELFTKDGRLVKGLKRASARLKAFGTNVTAIGKRIAIAGAAIMAPLAGSVKAFTSMGDRLDKMAKRTGVSVEALSELTYAAEQSGTEIGSLEKGMGRMQRTLLDAERGLTTAVDALDGIGLSSEKLKGLAPEDQFAAIAEGLSRVEDPSRKAALAMMIFGRSGTQLLPMMKQGARGIDLLRRKARNLGLTMSTEDAAAAAKLTDSFNSLWNVLKRTAFTIGSALAPVLNDLTDWFTTAGVAAGRWIKENKGLVVAIAAVAAGLVAGGVAVGVFGLALSGLGAIVGLAATAISAFGAVLGFILSPIGLVIAAVGALGGYLVYASGHGGKAVGWLSEKFGNLKQDATKAFTGISDALAASDIGLAARIFWLTLKQWWVQGIGWLKGLWWKFKAWFLTKAHEALSGVLVIFQFAFHGIEVAWIETTAFLSKTWTKFTHALVRAWRWAGNLLKKAWNRIKGLFDKEFDAEAANTAADEAYQAGLKRLEQEKKAALEARERERSDERAAAKEMHDATLRRILSEHDAYEKRLQDEYDQKQRDLQSRIDKLRAERDKAIAEARQKRIAKERGDKGPGPLRPPPDLDEIMKRIGSIATDFRQATDKVSVRGTFGGAAAWGMAAGTGAAEKTAKNTGMLVDDVRGMRRDIRKSGMHFA